MTPLEWLITIFAASFATTVTVFKKYYMPAKTPDLDTDGGEVIAESITDTKPLVEANTASQTLLWDTPQHAFHSTRVLCDEAGLTVKQKNEICGTIYGESEFDNRAVCKNMNAKDEVTSIDVGICQINSYWHCGKGKTFPSTDYVVAHPEEAVKFMIKMYKAGQINLWVAHKSGRYLTFLKPNSVMWKLRV